MPAGGRQMRTRSRWPLAVWACVVLLAGPTVAQDAPRPPHFVDETAGSGLATSYAGEWEFIVGGGPAVFDCNGDGRADVLLPGGIGTAQLYRNVSERGGALHFEPVASGLELDSVSGAYPLDVDSDGITDVVMLRVGENRVMRGTGDCHFAPANAAWGFDGGDGWSTAFAATWEKGAVWPTLAIGNYVDRMEQIAPWGTCTDNWLHRPASSGQGWAPPLPLTPSYCALSLLFTDWNRSGTPSLRVSNDREYYEGGQEQMWEILPGTQPRALGEKDGWKSLRIWGMGIASYDLNADGYPEYFLTSMGDNKLQAIAPPGDGTAPLPDYKDVAYAKGVTAHRPYTGDDLRPSTAWHAQFADVNNDGLADLFVAKGNVDKMPDFAAHDPDNLLLGADDGKFVEAGAEAGIANNGTSRGGALADFNLDGRLDLLVTNRNGPTQIWRNDSTDAGHWVEVDIRQAGVNGAAIGGWLEVKHGQSVLRRELTIGGGHAGGQLTWWHFGLGEDLRLTASVIWPDGTRSEWPDLDADTFYRLERGRPAVALTRP